MRSKTIKTITTFVLATVMGASAVPMMVPRDAHAACEAGEKIDKTTVEETRKKIEAAGYSKPANIRKGCDNFWHASAAKDGKTVNVVVSPQGDVAPEGD
jgi:hypothetical protein